MTFRYFLLLHKSVKISFGKKLYLHTSSRVERYLFIWIQISFFRYDLNSKITRLLKYASINFIILGKTQNFWQEFVETIVLKAGIFWAASWNMLSLRTCQKLKLFRFLNLKASQNCVYYYDSSLWLLTYLSNITTYHHYKCVLCQYMWACFQVQQWQNVLPTQSCWKLLMLKF